MIDSKIRLYIQRPNIHNLLYGLLLIFYLPTFVTRIVDIPYWGIVCYATILLCDIVFLARIGKLSRPILYTLVLFGYFLLITVFERVEDTWECLLRTFLAVSFSIYMEYIFKRFGGKRAVCILMCAFEVFLYINLLFMLLYPNGMYQVITNGIYEEVVRVEFGAARTQRRVLWLLGHQTMLIRFTLPAICIAILYSYYKKGKLKLDIRSMMLIFACVVETIIANSAANYLILALFIGLFLFFHFKGRIRNGLVYFGIIVVYLFIILISDGFDIFSILSAGLGRNVSFSTRIPIWINTISAWLQKPIFGWGYIDETSDAIRQILSAGNPHSSYFWALFEGGIIGLILLIWYMQFYSRRIRGYWKKIPTEVVYAAFVCLLVCMVSDDHIFRSPFYLVIFSLAYHVPQLALTVQEK